MVCRGDTNVNPNNAWHAIVVRTGLEPITFVFCFYAHQHATLAPSDCSGASLISKLSTSVTLSFNKRRPRSPCNLNIEVVIFVLVFTHTTPLKRLPFRHLTMLQLLDYPQSCQLCQHTIWRGSYFRRGLTLSSFPCTSGFCSQDRTRTCVSWCVTSDIY